MILFFISFTSVRKRVLLQYYHEGKLLIHVYSFKLYYCAFRVYFCSSLHLSTKGYSCRHIMKKTVLIHVGIFLTWTLLLRSRMILFLLHLPPIRDISIVKSPIFHSVFLRLYPAFLVFVDFCLNICRFLFSYVRIYVSIHSITKKHFPCFNSNFSWWLLGCGLEALNLGLFLSQLPMIVFFTFITMFSILWMHFLLPWHCFKFFMLFILLISRKTTNLCVNINFSFTTFVWS